MKQKIRKKRPQPQRWLGYDTAAKNVIPLKLFDFLINFFYNIYIRLNKRGKELFL